MFRSKGFFSRGGEALKASSNEGVEAVLLPFMPIPPAPNVKAGNWLSDPLLSWPIDVEDRHFVRVRDGRRNCERFRLIFN